MKRFIKLMADVTLVLDAMMVTFYVINIFNPYMEFLDNEITHGLLLILSLTSAVLSVFLLKKLTK